MYDNEDRLKIIRLLTLIGMFYVDPKPLIMHSLRRLDHGENLACYEIDNAIHHYPKNIEIHEGMFAVVVFINDTVYNRIMLTNHDGMYRDIGVCIDKSYIELSKMDNIRKIAYLRTSVKELPEISKLHSLFNSMIDV